jgi:hypothetical protein
MVLYLLAPQIHKRKYSFKVSLIHGTLSSVIADLLFGITILGGASSKGIFTPVEIKSLSPL